MATSSMTPNSDPEVLSRAREALAKLETITVDGVLYQGYLNDARVLGEVKRDKIRQSDIINVGFPRSGNNWLLEIVDMVMQNKTTYAEFTVASRLLENRLCGFEERIKEMDGWEDPRILTTHLRASKLPDQVDQKGVKVIYIVRNPKDATLSWFKIVSKNKFDKYRYHDNWAEFLELSLTGEVPWGSWFDHVLDFEKFTQDHPSVPVFIAQFEKFKLDPEAEIRKLARFLGRPEEKVTEIVDAVEIKAMKAGVAAKLGAIEKLWLDETSQGVIAKGSIGEWKKHFTVDMNERFNREFNERMKGSKVAESVRKYM